MKGASCAFAHSAEELKSSPSTKDLVSNCSDDSTSVCSEETSLGGVWSSRPCWADADDDDDDEWQSMWVSSSQSEMHELSMVPQQLDAVPSSAPMTKAPSKAERRELAAAVTKAKRAALTSAVLEGLLRQAQAPHVYQD